MSKVPVIVLSGFLGSGKTTLLIQMIQQAESLNLRPAVLMNELGKQDVDAHLISDSMPGLNVEKLLDGCICCSKKSEIAGCIRQLLNNKPDVLFIELTGVANPEEIADALTEPQLLNLVVLKTVVTVMDAEHILEYNSIFSSDKQLVHTLRRQIEVADLLLLNKTDLVDKGHLKTIEKAIRKQNPSSLLLPTIYSRFDLKLIFADLKPLETVQVSFNNKFRMLKAVSTPPKEHVHEHSSHEVKKSHSRIQTITLPIEDSNFITERKIERFLTKWNKQLLRAKGYLTLSGSSDIYLMQFAGKRTTWQPSNYDGNPYLVLIGIDLDVQLLEQDWADLAKSF